MPDVTHSRQKVVTAIEEAEELLVLCSEVEHEDLRHYCTQVIREAPDVEELTAATALVREVIQKRE